MNQINNKIYIILVNYNGYIDTIECLESLLHSTYQNFQILVVDNSDTSNDFEIFKQWGNNKYQTVSTKFPEIIYPLINKTSNDVVFISEDELNKTPINSKTIFIKAKKNNGFAAANNIALKYIKNQNDYSFIWLLNNDTIIPHDFLLNMKNQLQIENNNGIFGTTLLYYDNPNIIQSSKITYNYFLGIGKEYYIGEPYDKIKDDKKMNTDIIIGANMFISKNCFEKTGLLEERYFLYYEENDYCYRAHKNNFNILIFPYLHIYHKHSASINKNDQTKKTDKNVYLYTNSKLIFHKKFFPYLFILVLITQYLKAIKYYLTGNIKLGKSTLKAISINL